MLRPVREGMWECVYHNPCLLAHEGGGITTRQVFLRHINVGSSGAENVKVFAANQFPKKVNSIFQGSSANFR